MASCYKRAGRTVDFPAGTKLLVPTYLDLRPGGLWQSQEEFPIFEEEKDVENSWEAKKR